MKHQNWKIVRTEQYAPDNTSRVSTFSLPEGAIPLKYEEIRIPQGEAMKVDKRGKKTLSQEYKLKLVLYYAIKYGDPYEPEYEM